MQISEKAEGSIDKTIIAKRKKHFFISIEYSVMTIEGQVQRNFTKQWYLKVFSFLGFSYRRYLSTNGQKLRFASILKHFEKTPFAGDPV